MVRICRWKTLYTLFLCGLVIVGIVFFLINNADHNRDPYVCHTSGIEYNGGNIPKIVISIISSHNSAEQRTFVRNSWLRILDKLPHIDYYFVVGSPQNAMQSKLLEEEKKLYNDIVSLDVDDSYQFLTEKTLQSMEYTLKNFVFDFFVKVDDDTFTRIDRIVKILNKTSPTRFYMGFVHKGLKALYDTPNKNDEIHYPSDMPYLVPFAAGPGYILSADLIQYIVEKKGILKRFYNEDVAVGTWLFPLDIHRVHNDMFVLNSVCSNDAIILHSVKNGDTMEKLYKNSKDPQSCFCKGFSKE
eukprot:TRINITY_DN3438_c0_g1_i5.p1 TRINITY_DN3438_c0_g1~~TRINITY_DN3438_c0_g1_i5.p1  ORF type:complete len:300 (+),score=50.34 TRINITY_DN3438_c0_g1_i5:182-1081(+)